jgi:hypothetical protein
MTISGILDDVDLETLKISTSYEIIEYTPNADLSKTILKITTKVFGVASAIDEVKHSKRFVLSIPSLN